MTRRSCSVITSMVKRCGDQASSFLGESAEMTLCHLIDNVSASRALAGLLQASENRNANLRGKVAGFLHFLVIQKSSELAGCRELDALKMRLKYLLNDNTPEARSSSRDVVKILIHNNVCSRAELDMVRTGVTLLCYDYGYYYCGGYHDECTNTSSSLSSL